MLRTRQPHHEDIPTSYNISNYRDVTRKRWNIWEDRPIVGDFEEGFCPCSVPDNPLFVKYKECVFDILILADIVELMEDHPKVIIFYNFDYELDILKSLGYPEGTERLEGFANGQVNARKALEMIVVEVGVRRCQAVNSSGGLHHDLVGIVLRVK